MMERLHYSLICVLIAICFVPPVLTYTSTLETELRSGLYNSSYDYLVRPDDLTNVTIKFVVLSLNVLDIKNQIMDLAGYFDVSWDDTRLSWSSNPTYSSINAIYSNDDQTWIPPLVLINSVAEILVMQDDISPIRISPTGQLRWLLTRDIVLHCDTDPTYYPFDTQECPIAITTWGYEEQELSLSPDSEALDTTYYHENGEWVYLSYRTESAVLQRGGQSLTLVSIHLKFRRLPEFYIFNTLIPIYLLAFLSGFIFKLTPDSGEKMGFVLTVLLAYAVYLTLVADYIPTTSDNMSILTVLLVMILSLSVGSVIVTIYVLRFHNTPEDEPMASHLLKFGRFMAKVSCWKKCWWSCKSRKVDEDQSSKVENQCVMDNNVTKEKTWMEPEEEINKLTWQELALIADHFCFRVYFIFISLLCVITLSVMLYGYGNS